MTPADPGLQPERTTLAWHRLSVLVGGLALIAFKWCSPALQTWMAVPPLLLISAALIIAFSGQRRYHAWSRALATAESRHSPDGRLLLFAATLCCAACLAAVAFVILVPSP